MNEQNFSICTFVLPGSNRTVLSFTFVFFLFLLGFLCCRYSPIIWDHGPLATFLEHAGNTHTHIIIRIGRTDL